MSATHPKQRLGAILLPLLVLLVCIPVAAFAQTPPAGGLHVIGEGQNHLDLSLADIATLPHQKIQVSTEKGVQTEYEGVPVAEILRKAGAPSGKGLKGPNMALGLVARAPDGYHVLYSLAEFDPAFNDRVIILADHHDGQPLDAREGPLRIVVPGDKREARWIRGVDTLEVVRVR